MAYAVRYHHLVRSEDLPGLDAAARARIKRAIETRLMTAPDKYGQPLRRTLKGYWKLRVGDYRVVFVVEGHSVTVLGIRHQRDIYSVVADR